MPEPFDNRQAHLYGYASHNQYEMVSGVFHIPLAETPPTDPAELAEWTPTVAVQAHAPYRKRTVIWRHTKKGNPPVCPAPESTGAFSFVGGTVEFATPRGDTSFGKFDWEVSGVYSFVEQARSAVADGFVLGSPTFALTTQAANAQNYGGQSPVYGAIAQAGNDAVYGYNAATHTDVTASAFLYNTVSFYPGQLFNGVSLNGTVSMDSQDVGGGSFAGAEQFGGGGDF